MRRRRIWLALAGAGILAAILLVVWLCSRPEVLYDVAILPTLGGSCPYPRAINDQGQVVGIVPTAPKQWHLFLWDKETGMRDLGPCADLAHFDSVLINDAGQIAATGVDPNGSIQAFLQDPNGIRHVLRAPGGEWVHIRGLNNQGQVVGYSGLERGPRRAFLWDKAGGMRNLAPPGTIESLATGVNDAGRVVGFLSLNRTNQWHAFLYDPNTGPRDFGLSPFGPMCSCQINNQDFVVGQFGAAEDETCLSAWTLKEGTQRLNSLGGKLAHAGGRNQANRFLVCIDRPKFEMRSLSFRPHVYSYLFDPDGHFTDLGGHLGRADALEFHATGINSQGQITGLLKLEGHCDSQGVVLSPIK